MNRPPLFPPCRIVWLILFWATSFAWAADAPPITLHVYQRGYVEGGQDASTRLTDAAIVAFIAREPTIAIKVIGVPWGKEGDLKLRTALLARRRIDCFRLSSDQLSGFLPRSGRLLAPITTELTPADRDDFGPAALAALTRSGKLMAWPLWSTALALVANPDLLRQAGIAAPEGRPFTWTEFEAALDALARLKTPAGEDVHGLNAASRPPLFEWAPLLMAHCGPLLLDQPATDSCPLAPDLAGALDKVSALKRSGLLAPGFGIDDQPAAQAQFLEGRLGFLMTSPGFIRTLNAHGKSFMVLPPPTGDLGEPITTGALACFAVVDCGDGARIAAAHRLARWLTSAEIAEAVPGWYLAPPARQSIATFYDQPGYAALRSILPSARYLSSPVSTGFLEGAIIPRLQGAVLGQLPATEAIGEIQSAWRRQRLE